MKTILQKTGLVLGGILLALALAEVVVRVTGLGAVRPQLQFDTHTQALVAGGQFVADRRLFWRQADGPRDPLERQFRIIHPADQPAPKGQRYRILCLGDSCTRLSGQGPPYSALIERELGPSRVEVYNASLPGYSSHQGLAWLESQLLAFQPDLVVVYFGWNDHWRSTGWTDRDHAARLASAQPRLWQLLQRPVAPPPLRVSTAEYAENLRRIAELVAARGGRTMLLTAPYHFTPENTARIVATGYLLPDDRPEELHESYLAVVRSLAGYARAEVFDVADLFGKVAAPRMLMQRDGIHLRESGHAALATLLSQHVAHRHLGAPGEPVPLLATLQAMVAQYLAAEGQWQASLQRYRAALDSAPEAPGPRLGLAWLLATCPDDEVRDGRQALALLEREDLPAFGGPQYLDIRAAALAENGRFAEAIDLLAEAIAQVDREERAPPEMAAAFRVRLDLYRRGEPYRLDQPSAR